MKVLTALLKFLPFVSFAEGTWIGGNLRKYDSFGVRQADLGTDNSFQQGTDNPFQQHTKATCQKDTECMEGCFCGFGICKHYGGVPDGRCDGKDNGFDLGDGGFCWDGRRDKYCLAVDPKSNEKVPRKADVKEPKSTKEGAASDTKEGEASDAPVGEVIDEQMDQAEADTHKTMRRAGKMDPAQMFVDDLRMMFDYLMPGKRPDVWKKLVELIIVFFAVMWFMIYRYYLFESDRCPKHVAHGYVAREDDQRIQVMKPDVVLVFHKPDFDHKDRDNQVPAHVVETALTGKQGNFPRSEALLDAGLEHDMRHTFSRKVRRAAATVKGHASKAMGKPPGDDDEVEGGVPMGHQHTMHADGTAVTGIKLGEFRTALLQDICEHFPEQGFDVAAFASVDDDEVFVCIALRNKQTVRQHLQRYGMKLQLKPEAVQTLDIDQPPDEIESSPPYIRYDRRLAENVFGEGKKDLDIFTNYGAHTGRPTIIAGIDRIRMIYKHLNSNVNLDYAVAQGLLVQWYPAHAEARIAELRGTWANWSLLTDLSVRQPLNLIKDYYGSRVAFFFAWMGLYTKMLLCLLPVAILWVVLNFIAHIIGKTEYWHRGSVMGISIVIIIWGKVTNNLWKKEEEFFKVLWGLDKVDKDRSERPDFHGTLEPDEADHNKSCLHYPGWKYSGRKAISWIITLLFCTFVFSCVTLWLDLFSGRMNIAASICQAIMIQVFTQIYNILAEKLTLGENHKYQDDFYTSYLQKMFIFQLVNQYSAFFYMAVKMQFTPRGCPNDDCVGVIQQTMPITLLVLCAMQFVQVLVGTWIVKLTLWYEKYQMVHEGTEEIVYSYVEEQSKYGQFRVREQIEVMSQLSLTLGYILIFGCVAPRIVPLCFLAFMIQLRASGILMTTALKRTVPRISVGIGQWNGVFYFLMILGVLFSAYLLVQFAPLFHGTLLITKLSGFFVYCFFIGIVWVLVDIFCPPTDCRTVILGDRRDVVECMVMQISDDKNFEDYDKLRNKKVHADKHKGTQFYAEEISKNAYTSIPKLIPTNEGDPRHISHNQDHRSMSRQLSN